MPVELSIRAEHRDSGAIVSRMAFGTWDSWWAMTIAPARTDAGEVRSVLRWMGSKRRISAEIVQQMHAGDSGSTYFEPFFGGGSVLFSLRPERAVVGDMNADLVNAWTQIRDAPSRVHQGARALATDADTYYAIRAQATSDLDPIEAAVRFVYLNRNCFNGIYRTNRRDEFNVPFGSNTGALPPLAAFEACAAVLAEVEIRHSDFEATVARARAGDTAYFDPPWDTSRASYGEYGYSDTGASATERLAKVVRRLTARGVACYLSLPSSHVGAFDDLVRTDFSVMYNVASSSSRRRRSEEVLLTMEPDRKGGSRP